MSLSHHSRRRCLLLPEEGIRQILGNPFVGHESNRLTRHDTHQPRRETLPESRQPFLPRDEGDGGSEAAVLGRLSRLDYLYQESYEREGGDLETRVRRLTESLTRVNFVTRSRGDKKIHAGDFQADRALN